MAKWRNNLTRPEFEKNWNRSAPSFANINMLGKCNADCYFCLGKDIDSVFSGQNQMRQHFTKWPNFDEFLDRCMLEGISKIYLTGQNTDALLYKHLNDLIEHLQYTRGFDMGLRTNGFLAHKRLPEMNKLLANPGFSIHTLNPDTQKKMMGTKFIPDWDRILTEVTNCRVSIVVSRYNVSEVIELIAFLSKYRSVNYIQLRRICTDSREDYLIEDVRAFENLADRIALVYGGDQIGEFYGAPLYNIVGKEVCLWRTVKTDIDSLNYFTDGTISNEYFIIEGYMRESENFPKLKGIPVNAHGMGLEGFWRGAA